MPCLVTTNNYHFRFHTFSRGHWKIPQVFKESLISIIQDEQLKPCPKSWWGVRSVFHTCTRVMSLGHEYLEVN
ncbi:hypothetical protein POPTR_014G163733v4 [Populus trichocarpa]|uniref:Uncharacterized protein n=1 Tax=Populus trichocarpa TaxID=3694 RepID=A0ACC0S1C9_POPTR|nr:hypothetical protein POPTR_014G163733v4 [Populus trichocarpa]